MLSRVAERMYWAGRYLERVENTARLVNTYASLLLDLPRETGVGWPQLLRIVAAEDSFSARYTQQTEPDILRFLLADVENPGSILSSLTLARENVRTSRDIVPSEGWECVNELYLMGRRHLPGAVGRRRRFEVLSDCVLRCQQLAGLLSGTMSHGEGFNFFRMGSYLERADMTTRVVDVAAATLAHGDSALAPYENTLWMAVLRSLSAYQMYRQHVRRRVAAADVEQFLLSNRQFPRAVAYSLQALDRCLRTLPRSDDARRVLADLIAQVSAQSGADMDGAALHDYIDRLQLGFGDLHGAIQSTWFLKG
ncbi:MAG: alpha-E domain-containing protein [Myxococcales bacterium]|nr:alpha-E domain-containing protein [Myxococcales bacterium]